MAAVLMLDLDNTIADREAAFLTWAESKAKQWAPNQPDAVAFLVEEDADGIRARDEFFALLAERFRLSDPVEALVAEYRRELRAALPPLREDVKERLGALRAAGWKIALVTSKSPLRDAAKRWPAPGWSVIPKPTSSARTGPGFRASGCTEAGSGPALTCDRTTPSDLADALSMLTASS